MNTDEIFSVSPQEPLRLLDWVQAQLDQRDASDFPNYAVLDLRRCKRILVALLTGNAGIPALIGSGDSTDIDHEDNVRQARLDREAVLKILAVNALTTLSERTPEAERSPLKTLIHELSVHPSPVPPGLMPDRERGNSGRPGGYAVSAEAKNFFENELRPTLKNLDDYYRTFGSDLDVLAPAHYDHLDPNSLAAWGLAWTQATAAVATHWLFEKGGHTLRGVMNALQKPLQRFRAPTKTGGTLPADNDALHLELWARPFICQILRHNKNLEIRDKQQSYAAVHLSIKYLTNESIGGCGYSTGRRLAHIYLTVWLERVVPLLDDYTDISAMNTSSRFNLPPNLERDIDPGQHATINAAIEVIKNPSALKRRAGSYFVAPDSITDKLSPGDVQPSGEDPTGVSADGSEDLLFGVHELPRTIAKAAPAPPNRPECIGSVNLSWEHLSGTYRAEWMDLAFIVHHGQEWHALMLEIDEDENDESRVWLSIDPQLAKPWGIEVLRHALTKATWVYRHAGLGVFVAGAVDLDSPTS